MAAKAERRESQLTLLNQPPVHCSASEHPCEAIWALPHRPKPYLLYLPCLPPCLSLRPILEPELHARGDMDRSSGNIANSRASISGREATRSTGTEYRHVTGPGSLSPPPANPDPPFSSPDPERLRGRSRRRLLVTPARANQGCQKFHPAPGAFSPAGTGVTASGNRLTRCGMASGLATPKKNHTRSEGTPSLSHAAPLCPPLKNLTSTIAARS